MEGVSLIRREFVARILSMEINFVVEACFYFHLSFHLISRFLSITKKSSLQNSIVEKVSDIQPKGHHER